MNRSLPSVYCAFVILLNLPFVLAQENGWPRTLPLEQGTVTIYSPQVDEIRDDVIHFRAALAYRETAGSEPVFGAGWFESRVEIDSASRIVHPTDLKVTETRFPDGVNDVQSELAAALAQQSPGWNLDFSLDELEAALEKAEAQSMAEQSINTTPPRIVYRDHPALLISIDGEPVLRAVENSPYQAVINTPYPLIFDGRHYYLNAARDVWYRADEATGPYRLEARPPPDLVAMVKSDEAGEAGEAPEVTFTAATAPEIVVSTEPAQLIVTEGPAAFVPLVDDLLVLQNSDDDVFMHVSSQEFYIVLAGRWYHARSLDGPWAYRPADQLPPAFANIPRESDQADARVYVAGTQEAKDAVLDAQVPQTAAVARGEVDIEVEYDGEPVYQPVDGTDLVYIQNTGSTVLLSDGLYYLVEDGVWYVSTTPNGPWQVATSRPAQVDTILPTSPVHNVKYVHVYHSTPNVVYVGYTAGYLGGYVYRNTIIYGSGWYYQPWVSPYYYYPRHSTWGWNVNYNPWSGWSFGLSWGWGPFALSWYSGGYWHHDHYWHHRHYGRWGPGHYRPRHYAHHGYGRGHYRHHEGGYRARGYREQRHGDHGRYDNLYRGEGQRARIADTRDKRRRSPGDRRGHDNAHASLVSTGDNRIRYHSGNRKDGRIRITPIRASELIQKANVRDANMAAKRELLLADNSGKVYRKAGYGQRRDPRATKDLSAGVGKSRSGDTSSNLRLVRNDAVTRTSGLVKATKNRARPLPPESEAGIGRKRVAAKDGRDTRRAGRANNVAASRPSRERALVARAGEGRVRKSGAPIQQPQPGVISKRDAKRSPETFGARVQLPQPAAEGGRATQQRAPEVIVAAQRSKARADASRAVQQPPRSVQTQRMEPNARRPESRLQASRASGHSKPPSARSTHQGSRREAGSRRARSIGGGERREVAGRPKDS